MKSEVGMRKSEFEPSNVPVDGGTACDMAVPSPPVP
jgi:hypothetical protein